MPADSSSSVPLPDYEVEQYFPREHFDESPEEVKRLRQRYGYVRTYFKRNPAGHRDLQRWLNQTRVGTTYDLYLTQSLKLAFVTAVFGSLVGLALTFVLARAGVLANASSPVSFGIAAQYVVPLLPYKVPILGAALVGLVGGLAAAGTYYARYYLPKSRAEMRGRSIDILLPHAIVYMYALSHGGMSFLEVIRSVADAPDYGEVSREFEMIARDMDLFGNDLFTALRNSRNLTPSINFEQFLDDLLSVLDSGGDVTAFLDRESATYLEEARDEQEDFIETLSMLSEVFVAAFVAAPLLLIVTLMVISFLGGDTLVQLYALNYLIFPLGMALFLLLVDVLSSPYTQDTVRTKHDVTVLEEIRTVVANFLGAMRREVQRAREARWGGGKVASDGGFVDERLDDYRRENAVYELRTLVGDPLDIMRRQPYLSAVVTVPLAVLSVVGVFVLGLATPTLDAMLANPYNTTVWFVVLPFAIVAVPLTVFHELRTRRERTLERRFPDTLNLLSSANQMGISLVEALALVSRWSNGALADELRALRNDIRWNHDAHSALMAFASRLNVPQLSRVIRLIASGGRTSGDLSRVLSVAAEDTRNRYKLEKSRRRAMGSYIAIVVIGYFVYLFVILMLGASYLGPLAEMTGPSASASMDGQSLPIGISSVPLANFHVVFFHSALIQAVGSGLLAGKLADNSALSGLKYALGLSALALVAFALV
ncbi:type IV pilus biogenesis complex membrane subunit [Haloferax gibbonsii ATCC 33959]|uniref:Type IV pilus biogenesis complex membrane subunit n=1 Tax=Haloferax gibbonsii (strain ATCC 33959 / DSM 4427 / JCM 8863 / NBRC 102184 / NCIMB 2188 / Ma 2.38) TaxID=1227459 RepID=M0HAI9_HALGM|nr:type II secretion system F family protein [Haloferax gibbonsii]ELZ80742.1 type IV pilus biogenesis complex membrane subunit [Haloferax gibbonsii ATCC 33959]